MKIITFLLVLSGLTAVAQQDSSKPVTPPLQPVEQVPQPVEQTPKPVEQLPPPQQQKQAETVIQAKPKADSVKKTSPLKRKFDWSKVYTGGDFGLSFGTVTAVNISPIIGYRITPKYSAGVGITYIYYNFKPIKSEFSIYGGSIFNRYQLFDFLFAHVEYQALNGPWETTFNKRYFINNFWVGGGLSQSIGGNSNIGIMILWNLNQDGVINYPPSPWIRVGINIGL